MTFYKLPFKNARAKARLFQGITLMSGRGRVRAAGLSKDKAYKHFEKYPYAIIQKEKKKQKKKKRLQLFVMVQKLSTGGGVKKALRKAEEPPNRTRLPIREAPSLADLIENLAVEYRFLFVIPIVLPLSFLFTKFWAIRDA
ncbi:hypothetical protein HDU67_010179, partial [Dinochytrium kinnereticum]